MRLGTLKIMSNHGNLRLATALISTSIAVLVWTWPLWSPHSLDLQQLQNVEQVHSEVVAVLAAQHSVRIQCRVTNLSPQTAEEIVLAARILDQHGNVVAANPLGSISDIPPHATRDTEVMVPISARLAHYTAEVDSSLVRWAD